MKIRQGVKLKPVTPKSESVKNSGAGDGEQVELDFNQALLARFKQMNMKEKSDSEDDEADDTDW